MYVRAFGEDPAGELYVCVSTEIAITGTAGVVKKIMPVGPTADFTADVTSGTAPLTVQFTDASTPGTAAITSWSWAFGDSAVSTDQNPNHQYTIVGTYTVTLTVTTSVASDGETKTDYITVNPVPVGCACAGGAPVALSWREVGGDVLLAGAAMVLLVLQGKRRPVAIRATSSRGDIH
jgi:PKD repeat protein